MQKLDWSYNTPIWPISQETQDIYNYVNFRLDIGTNMCHPLHSWNINSRIYNNIHNNWSRDNTIPLLLSITSVLTAPTLAFTSFVCLELALVSIGSSPPFTAAWLFELTSLAGGGTGVTTGLFAAASLFTRSTWIGPLWLFKWIWYFLPCWIGLAAFREKVPWL